MAVDPNLMDPNNITQTSGLSATEPANSNHPAINFLSEFGIATTGFPSIRFLIEANEKNIRVGRMILPIRFPQHPGFVYDSVVRIARVLEVPQSAQKTHRKFFEIEWSISEVPVVDSTTHPALSFLATESECASCREIFMPDPEFLNESTVRLVCPNCLNYWTISVTAATQSQNGPELLFDLFQRDPRRAKNYIEKWVQNTPAANDKIFYSYFPYQFDSWTESSSLDWLFDETKGWSAISNGGDHDFESLFKGFLNQLAFEHFKNHFARAHDLSELEQTEVKRKTEVQKKEAAHRALIEDIVPGERPQQQDEVTPTHQMRSARVRAQMAWTAPDTAVKQVPLPPRKKRSASASFAIAAVAVAGVLGGLVYKFATSPLPAPSVETVAIDSQKIDVPTPRQEVAPTKVEKPATNIEQVEQAKASIQKATPPKAPKAPAVRSSQLAAEAELKAAAEQKRLNDLAVETGFRQGMMHLKLQQSKEAIQEFKKVLAIDSKHAESLRGLGLAYVYEQNFEDAITALTKYLKLSDGATDRDSVEELIATLKERAISQ